MLTWETAGKKERQNYLRLLLIGENKVELQISKIQWAFLGVVSAMFRVLAGGIGWRIGTQLSMIYRSHAVNG